MQMSATALLYGFKVGLVAKGLAILVIHVYVLVGSRIYVINGCTDHALGLGGLGKANTGPDFWKSSAI